jgi:RNA methyltransferase, TrmH family
MPPTEGSFPAAWSCGGQGKSRIENDELQIDPQIPLMLHINSPYNPRIKDAVRLRDRRHREKQGRILIDGVRELQRALGAGVRVGMAFVCESLCRGEETQALLAALASSGCEVLQVNESVFDKLAFGQRTEGVVGIAETPRPTLDSLALSWGGSSTATPSGSSITATPSGAVGADVASLVAVLEGVEKPGNVGAVLRSADAAGVSAVIVADPRTDLYNPNAIRASLGTIFTIPVCQSTSGAALAWLRERRFAILAARVDGSVPYTAVDYRGPTAIVLGSEAAGLSPIWAGGDIQAVRLPMLGVADSLNVSASAAVLFYEALRQRRGSPP